MWEKRMKILEPFEIGTIPFRFWAKVEKLGNECGCWLWTGSTNHDGYGNFRISRKQGVVGAHRMAFWLQKGQWPEQQVLHTCDTPSCVRGEHLFLGTHQDNMEDMRIKRRTYRGPEHIHAKLDYEKAEEIRAKYVRNVYGVPRLAKEYSVDSVTIHCILRGITWNR
jgi:hypothetical protein